MRKSSKILLYGSLVSVLYIILCIFIHIDKEDYSHKSENITKQEFKETSPKPIGINLDKNISSVDNSSEVEIKNNSTLGYKIENGVITISGNMPILAYNDSLKNSMMRFCLEEYCNKTIVFSPNKETPSWKKLAENIIDLFYDENLTNASFNADNHGDITIGGELLTKSSKDKIREILKKYPKTNITDNTHLKVIQPKEKKDNNISDKNESKIISISDVDIVDKNISIKNISIKDNIDIAQDKISELLKTKKINFYRNRAKITPRGKRTLRKILTILKDVSDVKIEVKGYTDASGKRSINRWISKERAKSVKNYLGSHGINPINIKAKGFGEDDLLYENRPYSPLNRRVEIEIKRR